MKRLLLLSFLTITVFSFSQSEIWGVRLNTDNNKGAYLYNIDSASNKIIEQQYFAGDKVLTGKNEIFHDTSMNCLFGVANQILYKYDLVNRTTESCIIEEELIGNLVKGSNGYLYTLERKGVLKINPQSLKIEKIGPFYGKFILPDTIMIFEAEIGTSFGLNKVSDDEIIISNYFQDNTYNWKHNLIYSINTNTDSIELIYRTSIYPENEYLFPMGKFYPYNGLLYALFTVNNEIALYSFDTENKELDFVYSLNEIAQYEIDVPYTISADGKLYGKAREVNTIVSKLFQYDIDDDFFSFLSDLPEETLPRSTIHTDYKNDLYIILDNLDDSNVWTTFYKYNAETHQLDSLFNINSKYWYEIPHYEDIGPISPLNNGFLSFVDSNTDSDNHIVFYNIENQSIDTITTLPSTISYTDSLYLPEMYCETEKGNILFYNTRLETISDTSWRLFINLTEFDPQSKVITKKPEIEIYNGDGVHKIIHLKDDIFFISYSVSSFIIYNGNTNEYETIAMPFSNWGTWIKESENSLVFSNGLGVFRYQIGASQLEPIYQPNADTLIEKISLYMGDNLLIYTLPGDDIMSLDLVSNELGSILPLSELSENQNLMQVQNLFAVGEYIYIVVVEPSEAFLYRFHPETNDLTLIDDYLVWNSNGLKFIENPTKDGVYITDIYENNNDPALTLRLLRNTSDTVIIVDYFNEFLSYMVYDNNYWNHLPFIKVKKKPIHRWIGEVSNNWYEVENWSNGALPNDSSSVNIMNNAPFYPEIDTILKLKNLFIYDEAKMILGHKAQVQVTDDFKNNGRLRMMADEEERSSLIVDEEFVQIGVQKYFYCADSINDKNLASPMKAVEKYVQPFYSEAAFNENTFAFSEIQFYPHFSETCQALQYTCQDTMLEFKGSFNHGPQNLHIPLLSEEELYPLANPYPSSFNWNKTQITSLSHQACYFYNEAENTISATVDGIGNHPPFIRPLEVFWVYGNGEESIQIDHSALMHEQDYEEETSDKKVLSLQVSGAKKTDQTMIAFNDLASKNYDPKLDAFKFIKNENYPHIFTKAEEELLMINQHPDTTMMNLFVQMGEDGNMGIKLADNHGFDYLVLEDLIWHTRTDLLEADYQFDYFTSDGHYPFKLYFKPWVLEPIEEADIQMYYYPEFLVVKSRKQVKQAEITFYDLAGRVVLEFSEQNFFHIEKPIDIPAGHYIVQLRSGDVVINEKILVR